MITPTRATVMSDLRKVCATYLYSETVSYLHGRVYAILGVLPASNLGTPQIL